MIALKAVWIERMRGVKGKYKSSQLSSWYGFYVVISEKLIKDSL